MSLWSTKRTLSLDTQVGGGTSGTGFASKMKKVLSYSSPLNKKRRSVSAPSVIPCPGLIFGVKLENSASSQSSPVPSEGAENEEVPLIVSKIVQHIEQRGLQQEGVYRINGNAKVIERLKVAFDKLGDADIRDTDTYAVGGLLKLYLRELPVAVVPDALLPQFVRLQEAYPGALTAESLPLLKEKLAQLPSAHYNLLKYLCRHLMKVAQHSGDNKMTPVSLSIVFGPNIFRCGGGLSGLQTQGYTNALFCQMIHSYYQVFEDGDGSRSSVKSSSDEKDRDESEVTVLTENSPSTTTFRRNRLQGRRKKPAKPRPYSDHMAEKQTQKLALSCDDLLSSAHWEAGTSQSETGNESTSSHLDSQPEPSATESTSAVGVTEETQQDEEKDEQKNERKKKRRSPSSDKAPLRDKSGKRRSGDSHYHHHEKRKSRKIPLEERRIMEEENSYRSSSPHSWQSSPGASPPTSPVLTPRSSQVYSSLIEDTIQQYLFDPSTSSQSRSHPPTVTSTSSFSSGDDHYHEQRSSLDENREVESALSLTDNQVVSTEFSEEEGRSRASTSPKDTSRTEGSSVLMSTGDLKTQKYTATGIGNVQLAAVELAHNQGSGGKQETSDVKLKPGKVSELAGMFERSKQLDSHTPVLAKENDRKREASSKDTECSKMTSQSPTRTSPSRMIEKRKASPPPVASKPKRTPITSQGSGSGTANNNNDGARGGLTNVAEFDYISRASGELFHPTLQRVRGPLNRMKPSRRSLMRMKRATIEESMKCIPVESKIPEERKKISPDQSPQRHKSSPTHNANSPKHTKKTTSSNSPPPQTGRESQRQAPVKLTTESRTHSSRLSNKAATSTSTSGGGSDNGVQHHKLHVGREGSSAGVREKKGLHVAPEEKPNMVEGWREGGKDAQVVVDLTTHHLVQKAHDLKTQINRFEDDFQAKTGRKPEDTEKAPVSHLILELAAIRKQLKAVALTHQHDKQVQSNSPSLVFKTDSTVNKESHGQTSKHAQHEQRETDKQDKKAVIIVTQPISPPERQPHLNPSSNPPPSLPKSEAKKVPHRQASQQEQREPEGQDKTATVRRHKSLPSSAKPSKPRVRMVAEAEALLQPVINRIMTTLTEKRSRDGRPDNILFMSTSQLRDEKHAVQRALLSFEHKYGRPQARPEKEIMRPIYDYYRDVKRLLSSHAARKNGLNQSTQEDMNTTADTLPSVTMLSSSLAHSVPSNLQTISAERTKGSAAPKNSMGLTTRRRSLPQPPPPSSSSASPAGVKREATDKPCSSAMPHPQPVTNNHDTPTHEPVPPPTATPLSNGSIHNITEQQLLKLSITDLQHHHEEVLTMKKQLRRELRKFEINFEQTHKRRPDKSDKHQIYSQYVNYKTVKRRLHLIESMLQKDQLQKTV